MQWTPSLSTNIFLIFFLLMMCSSIEGGWVPSPLRSAFTTIYCLSVKAQSFPFWRFTCLRWLSAKLGKAYGLNLNASWSVTWFCWKPNMLYKSLPPASWFWTLTQRWCRSWKTLNSLDSTFIHDSGVWVARPFRNLDWRPLALVLERNWAGSPGDLRHLLQYSNSFI